MHQYRDLGMREYLDRLAAEDDRGDAVAAVRGHDDKVTAFRLRGLNDRLVGMLMLDIDCIICDARCSCCVCDGAKVLSACSFMRALYCAGVSSIICVSVVSV